MESDNMKWADLVKEYPSDRILEQLSAFLVGEWYQLAVFLELDVDNYFTHSRNHYRVAIITEGLHQWSRVTDSWISKLDNALVDMGRIDLLEQLKRFREKPQRGLYDPFYTNARVEYLMILGSVISIDWKTLFRYLEVDEHKITDIEMAINYQPSITKTTYQVLLDWKNLKTSPPHRLFEALEKLKFLSLLSRLRDTLYL